VPPPPPPPAPAPPVGFRLLDVQEIEVTIEKLVAGGDGLARHDGVPIFVPRSAPGDRLRVRLTERRPQYGRAEIVEILAPGAGRRVPPCPHFARCGGCDLQHLEDDLQLEWKARAFLETLRRMGGVDPPVGLEFVRGAPWGYRTRCQLHTGRIGERVVAGYHARGSHELVVIDRCPVLDPALETAALSLAPALPASPPPRVDLAVGDDGELSVSPPVEGLPQGEISRRVGEFVYRYDARCFFQGHGGLLAELVECAVGEERGGTAFDLYGGVGLFALPLARRYAKVILVEGDRIAARYARRNAQAHRLAQLEVVAQAVESWIPALPADADRVLADPPRDGLSTAVRRELLLRPPRRLTYVSCHPAALARDLQTLNGVLRLERLTLLDLFPQTGEIEAVAQLARIDG
jgi:23S rRNA (uracil1939-C5)-methyltransferase